MLEDLDLNQFILARPDIVEAIRMGEALGIPTPKGLSTVEDVVAYRTRILGEGVITDRKLSNLSRKIYKALIYSGMVPVDISDWTYNVADNKILVTWVKEPPGYANSELKKALEG